MSFVPLKVCTCQNIPMHFVFLSCWNVIAWTSWGFGKTTQAFCSQNSSSTDEWVIEMHWLIITNRCESGQLVNGHVWSPWWVIQFSRWEQRNICCCGFNWALASHCLYQQQQSSRVAAEQQATSRKNTTATELCHLPLFQFHISSGGERFSFYLYIC